MNEQYFAIYDVKMKTPIGIRLGRMTVHKSFDKVNGCLDILNHSEAFEGTIDNNGNCDIVGKIITLIKTINYKASGKITSNGLDLFIINDRHHVFEIIGTPISLVKEQ